MLHVKVKLVYGVLVLNMQDKKSAIPYCAELLSNFQILSNSQNVRKFVTSVTEDQKEATCL